MIMDDASAAVAGDGREFIGKEREHDKLLAAVSSLGKGEKKRKTFGSNQRHETAQVASEFHAAAEREHDKLLAAVTSLGKGEKKRKTFGSNQRHETAQVASEFHAAEGESGRVKLNELVTALTHTTTHKDLKNKLGNVGAAKKSEPVAIPLAKHQLEKIERKVAYEKSSTDLKIWEPVIHANRKSEQLQFPLIQPEVRLVSTEKFVTRFKPSTPLEMEVAALLDNSPHSLKPDQMLTRAEERALKAMSILEAKKRRAELQKHRALVYYKESKAKRTKKIKSKSYHKILRKEKAKRDQRTLEELQVKDHDAYLEKLQHMDRTRLQERMSLKHRGGSKFMKKQSIYAKYDNQARQSIQDMIHKNKELLEKVVQIEEEDAVSDIEDGEIEHATRSLLTESQNPWMTVSGVQKKKYTTSKPQAIEISQPDLNEDSVKAEDTNADQNVDESLGSQNLEKDSEFPNVSDITDKESDKTDEVIKKDEVTIPENLSKKQRKKLKRKLNALKRENTNEDTNQDSEKQVEVSKDSAPEVKLTKKQKKKLKKLQDEKNPSKKVKTGNSADLAKLSAEHYENIDDIFKDVVEQTAAKRAKLEKSPQQDKSKNLKAGKESSKKKKKNKKKKSVGIDTNKMQEQNIKNELKQEVKRKRQESESESESSLSESSDSEDEKELANGSEDEGLSQSLKRKNKLEDFELDAENIASAKKKPAPSQQPTKPADMNHKQQPEKKSEVQLDPNKFFTVDSSINEDSRLAEDGDTADSEQIMTIAEAFASDDVVDEFIQLKKDAIKKDQPKDIDLSLPGWGSWGGTGIKRTKRKRNKFLIKAPEAIPRRDQHLTNIIISETKNTSVAKHQVNQLPFPFTNVHDFQRSLRQPIGKTWNPETAFKALSKPRVTTARGTLIEPIDKSEVFKQESDDET